MLGLEHTFFATVGVPWLELQFRELLEDRELVEEGRYLVGSAYATLGCPEAFECLSIALGGSENTRILLCLETLLEEIGRKRKLSGADLQSYNHLLLRLRRRLSGKRRRDEAKRILKFKSKLIELEVKRIKRLESENDRKN